MKVGMVRTVVTVQWSMALVLALPPLLGFNRCVHCAVLYCTVLYCTVLRYVYEGYLYSSTVDFTATSQEDRLYLWTLLAMGYILPNIIIVISHLSIIGLYRHNKFQTSQSDEPGTSFVTHKKVEVVVTSSPCLVNTDITPRWRGGSGERVSHSWRSGSSPGLPTPRSSSPSSPDTLTSSTTTSTWSQARSPGDVSLSHSSLTAVFCKTSSAINPLLYGLMLPSFRNCLAKLCRRLGGTRRGRDRRETIHTEAAGF